MGIFSFLRSYMFPNGYVILLSHYRMPKKVEKDEKRTFRFAFIRRKIQTVFRSRALKIALLAELYGGKDAALVAQMVDKVTPLVKPPVQAVAPLPPQDEEEEEAAAAPANPPPAVQAPSPVRPAVQAAPAVAPQPTTSSGDTAATAVVISDSEDDSDSDID